MGSGLYSALSGAVAQSRALEVLASNLANTATTGFKGSQVAFKEVLAGAQGDSNNPPQRLVTIDAITPDLTQGPLQPTHNPLDVAIDGPGFFAVNTADGQRFTRAGSFALSKDGFLSTRDGFPVMGQAGEIKVPANQPVRIDTKGVVFSGETAVDTLNLVDVPASKLSRVGSGLWTTTDSESVTPVETKLVSGHLEGTNVNALRSMSEMIWLSRAYESFQKTIELHREIDRKTANELTV